MALVGIYGAVMFTTGSRLTQTFFDLRRRYTSRFAAHEVHLQKPCTEYTGPGLVEVEFSMNLSTRWGLNPNILLAQLHFYHERAQAALLFCGGRLLAPGLSLFVCTTLEEQHKYFSRNGALIAAEVAVKLQEYRATWQALPMLGF